MLISFNTTCNLIPVNDDAMTDNASGICTQNYPFLSFVIFSNLSPFFASALKPQRHVERLVHVS